jgi:hypothetical protein
MRLTDKDLEDLFTGLSRGEPPLVRRYLERVHRTFDRMQPYLPAAASAVLDVGCGMGGAGLRLVMHYGPSTRLYLLDGTNSDARRRGGFHRPKGYRSFAETCSPWNDATATAAAMRSLGVDAVAVPTDPTQTLPSDVIVSTRSWGHHYPVGVYLDLARRSLLPGGRLFLDLRPGYGGLEKLCRYFRLLWSGSTSLSGKCVFAAFSGRDSVADQ